MILLQHPQGIRLGSLFELLEQRYKNGCFYIDGRPLYEGSGYRRVRTEILAVLEKFTILVLRGRHGSNLLLTLNSDKRTITQKQLSSVLRFAKECSNSQAKEPRIAAKIKKVFAMYPKVCKRVENEAAQNKQEIHDYCPNQTLLHAEGTLSNEGPRLPKAPVWATKPLPPNGPHLGAAPNSTHRVGGKVGLNWRN